MAVPEASGAGLGGLDVPFEEDHAGCWALRGEEQVLHFHVSHLADNADAKHGFGVAGIGKEGASRGQLRPGFSNNLGSRGNRDCRSQDVRS